MKIPSNGENTVSLRPTELILRCYVEEDNGNYFASCLDLGLHTRENTIDEAKEELSLTIQEYLAEALDEDLDDFQGLAPSPAPIFEWLKYYFYLALIKADIEKMRVKAELFTERLPLKLAS